MRIESKLSLLLCTVVITVWFCGCSTATADVTAVNETTFVARPYDDPAIKAVLDRIDQRPDVSDGYTQLAALYIKKARETGNFSLNTSAEAAVDKAIAINAEDLVARKLKASLQLTFHRFADSLEEGKKLASELPYDAFVYGILTDANAELGNYPEAVVAAQKMVDLKPTSSSYARVAHIRSLHGDYSGAVEMYKVAAKTTDLADREAQAWCLVQLGNEYWRAGKYTESERVNDEALQVLPNYHHALFGKGRTLASRGELASAAGYLVNAQAHVPSMETAILLGEIYERLGDRDAAGRQASIMQSEEALGEHFDEHRLAHYWADNGVNLDRALEIAQADYAVQKDIYASDTLAWCLFRKGRFAEAKIMIAEAMRLGTRDAKLFYHAGMIEQAVGNRIAAKRYLQTALRINPAFDLAQSEIARQTLRKL